MVNITRRIAGLQIAGMALALSALPARAAENPLKQWFIYRETGHTPEKLRSGVYYRLANSEMVAQFRYDGKDRQLGGITWGWISRSGDNRSMGSAQVRFARLLEDPAAGDRAPDSQYLMQDEPLAMEYGRFGRGPGYLVYRQRASEYHLAWQRQSGFHHRRSNPDIYQWRLRNATRRSFDHRKSDLVEERIYALYNAVADQYLLAIPKSRTLLWEKAGR